MPPGSASREAPPFLTLGTVLVSLLFLILMLPSASTGLPFLGVSTQGSGVPSSVVAGPVHPGLAGAPSIPTPKYTVNFTVVPASCGPIQYNGTGQSNATSGLFRVGSYASAAPTCAGYSFQRWSWTGALAVAGPTSSSTTTTVSGDGNLTASYTRGAAGGGGGYNVAFTVNPTFCGPLTVNGTTQASGTSASFKAGTYPAIAPYCGGYTFTAWSSTGGVALSSSALTRTNITVSGPGMLGASYVQNAPGTAGHRYNVTFVVVPSICAAFNFNGTAQTNGSWDLFRAGNYSVLAPSCVGRSFHGWSASGGVQPLNSLTNPTTVSVQANGTLTATYWTNSTGSGSGNGSSGTSTASLEMLGLLLVVVAAVVVGLLVLRHRRRSPPPTTPAPPPPASSPESTWAPPPSGG